MEADAIRTEMGEILDRLATLPADAFAERGALRDRQEELRRGLAAIDVPGADAIKRRWNEQAGSKPPIDGGEPVIVSPIESGGGGGPDAGAQRAAAAHATSCTMCARPSGIVAWTQKLHSPPGTAHDDVDDAAVFRQNVDYRKRLSR